MRLDVLKRTIVEMLDEVTAARRRREQLEHYAYHSVSDVLQHRFQPPSLLKHADLAMYARKSVARANPQDLFPLRIDTGESHHVAAS